MNSANRTGGAFIRDPATGVVTRDDATTQTVQFEPTVRTGAATEPALNETGPTPKAKKGH